MGDVMADVVPVGRSFEIDRDNFPPLGTILQPIPFEKTLWYWRLRKHHTMLLTGRHGSWEAAWR
jgi:hypothetical protein